MVYVHKSKTISPNFSIPVENEEDGKRVRNYKSSTTSLSVLFRKCLRNSLINLSNAITF